MQRLARFATNLCGVPAPLHGRQAAISHSAVEDAFRDGGGPSPFSGGATPAPSAVAAPAPPVAASAPTSPAPWLAPPGPAPPGLAPRAAVVATVVSYAVSGGPESIEASLLEWQVLAKARAQVVTAQESLSGRAVSRAVARGVEGGYVADTAARGKTKARRGKAQWAEAREVLAPTGLFTDPAVMAIQGEAAPMTLTGQSYELALLRSLMGSGDAEVPLRPAADSNSSNQLFKHLLGDASARASPASTASSVKRTTAAPGVWQAVGPCCAAAAELPYPAAQPAARADFCNLPYMPPAALPGFPAPPGMPPLSHPLYAASAAASMEHCASAGELREGYGPGDLGNLKLMLRLASMNHDLLPPDLGFGAGREPGFPLPPRLPWPAAAATGWGQATAQRLVLADCMAPPMQAAAPQARLKADRRVGGRAARNNAASEVPSAADLFAAELDIIQSPGTNAAVVAEQLYAKGVTTVMIRNLPIAMTQKRFVEALHEGLFEGEYDFVYMPSAFLSREGKGYAFVNFTSPEMMKAFVASWHGTRRFDPAGTALSVAAATVQGCEANSKRWSQPRLRRVRNADLRPILVPSETEALANLEELVLQ